LRGLLKKGGKKGSCVFSGARKKKKGKKGERKYFIANPLKVSFETLEKRKEK